MSEAKTDPWRYEPVPKPAVRLFRMAWQLESWLRTLVYVELRASRVDWEEPIKQAVNNWPPSALTRDKNLHHMATPHQAALSYLTFGQLWSVISHTDQWPLFEPYFPPKDNTFVRIDEVKAIRNRVAHFREPHPQDVARMELFIRDMEPGIRAFCERYCTGKVSRDPADDLITQHLEKSWEQVGYGIELKTPNGWLYAPREHRQQPLMNATLDLLTHKKFTKGDLAGVIYRVRFGFRDGYDTLGIVESTKGLHKDIIHILLSSHDAPSVTIPAIHGVETTTHIVVSFLSAGLNNRWGHRARNLDRAKLNWPEYILWPNHMLTFFDEDMTEPVLDIPADDVL
jgi:hypothetical protein